MLVLGINLSFALHNQSVVAGGTLKGENCTQYIYWVCKSRYCVFDVRMHWKFVDNPWCVIPIYEGVIAYLRIFLLQPVRLRSRLQHKCKKKKAWIAHCAWKYMPLIYILMPTGCSYALHGIYVYHHLLSLFYFEYKIAHIYFLYGYHLPSLLLIIFIMGALIY